MESDAIANDFSQPHWHGIADHASDGLEAVFPAWLHEFVVGRERLENRSFAQGEAAVLFRVAEPSVAEAVKLRRDGGRGFVSLHAAIDAGIGLAPFLAMTLGNEIFWPVPPRAARRGGFDAA